MSILTRFLGQPEKQTGFSFRQTTSSIRCPFTSCSPRVAGSLQGSRCLLAQETLTGMGRASKEALQIANKKRRVAGEPRPDQLALRQANLDGNSEGCVRASKARPCSSSTSADEQTTSGSTRRMMSSNGNLSSIVARRVRLPGVRVACGNRALKKEIYPYIHLDRSESRLNSGTSFLHRRVVVRSKGSRSRCSCKMRSKFCPQSSRKRRSSLTNQGEKTTTP